MSQIDNNIYVKKKTAVNSPIMYWSPANNENCQLAIYSFDELGKLHNGFEKNSTYLENYSSAIFKNAELGNFEVLPNFDMAAKQAAIPAEVNKMINRKKETGVGAYPFTK